MLQDLVTAAVNEALDASRRLAEQKMGALRRPAASAPARALIDRRRVPTLLIEPVAKLIEAFNRLPGHRPEDRAATDLPPPARPGRGGASARRPRSSPSASEVVFCERCFNISDAPLCPICRDPGRDAARLCVVEEPLDVLALERTGEFRGVYHVLHGAISPIDGVGPDRLRIRELLDRVDEAARGDAVDRGDPRHQPDPRRRGDGDVPRRATAGKVGSVTRIARGIPVGGDLEYADEVTLIRALQGRRALGERPA